MDEAKFSDDSPVASPQKVFEISSEDDAVAGSYEVLYYCLSMFSY